MILTSRKGLMSSYIFVLHPLYQELPILPDIFLRKGIMEPALPCVFDCPPAWSSPPSVQLGFSLGWGYVKVSLGFFVQWNVFMQNFWNFQVIPITKSILTLVQNKLVLKNSSDSYGQVSWSDESFLLLVTDEVTSGWSQKVEISIWGLLRTELSQSIFFICMNNDLTRTRKHCLLIQIVCLWSERALSGT